MLLIVNIIVNPSPTFSVTAKDTSNFTVNKISFMYQHEFKLQFAEI